MRNHLLKSIFISLILAMGVSNAWGATIFNCGIEVNETWYKGTGTINSGNWLGDKTAFNNKDFGVITSLKLGGQYDTWDDGKTDQCSWNSNNGIKITISTESGTQKAEFKLSCFHSGKDGSNNVWKTTGTINNCGDKSDFGRYTYDISSYAAGKYKMKATWFSPSGISTNATAKFTIPGFTTTSISQTFDNTTVNSNSSKTISFGTHYGTTLKTNNCSISGTNHTEFSVTSINESGVTVQFKPTSAGSKTATLTITDAHSKKCTITLSGTAIATYTVTITNDGNGSTVPSGEQLNITEKDGISISAEAAENFAFTSWTIVSGTGTFDAQTSVSTKFYPTSDATIQANFRSTATNSLTVVAGAGIASVTGSTDPVTLGNSYTITATPKTGYTFSTWTADPAANATFGSATTANTNVTVKNGSVTVTASATEIMSTLTTSNNYDAGDPDYADPSANVSKIGIATTAKVTAAAAGNGYTFTGWTLTNCTRTDGGATDATSITVRSNGDGKAATVVANYAEDCKTAWVLAHSIDGFNTSSHPFVKKSGESTGKVAYVSLDLAANTAYTFKVKNGDKWYGNNNSEEQWWIKQTAEDWNFYSDAGDCHMKSGLAGTHTFKIDYSAAVPKVSVYFPEIYAIVGSFNEWNENANKLTFDGNIGTATINLEASATNYEFKVIDNAVHGGIVDKTITQTENDLAIIVGGGDNIKLTANANPKGNYIFTYDKSTKKLSVTYPTVYTITVEAENGTVEGAGTYVEGTSITLTATAADGYTFTGWSNGETANPYTLEVTKDITLTANFELKSYTITATAENGTVEGKGTYTHGEEVTLTATPNFDYVFVNWTVGGEVVSTANPYTFQATANVEVVANFQEVTATTAKSGKFSTGKYEYAEFATGNLQYNTENYTWRFAKQQYQVVGKDNINVGDPNYKGWIDMFGWSGDGKFGVNPSNKNEDYYGAFVDWGTKMGEGWLTLSADQWKYLLNERTDAASLKQIAKVGEILGIMLFPDNWTHPAECNVTPTTNHDPEDGEDTSYDFVSYNYTLTQWTKLEEAGAIFLPAAGRRAGGYGNTINKDQKEETNSANLNGGHYKHQDNTNIYCYYWTSTINESTKDVSFLHNIQALGGDKYTIGTGAIWGEKGRYGQSVRLAKVTSTLIEIGDGDNSDVIEANKDKIVNVQVNRAFKADDGYYTICLPFALDADEIGKAYELGTITEYEADGGININLTEVEYIEAGKPYLVLPKTLTKPIFENVTIVNTTGETIEPASGAGVNVTFTGIINGVGEETNGTTHYYVGDNGYLYNGKVAKLGLRAFFTITNGEGQAISNVRARVVAGENVETGVEDIITTDAPVKVIENGQLIIIRGGVKYNVQGVRL